MIRSLAGSTHLETEFLVVAGTSFYQIGAQEDPLVRNSLNSPWNEEPILPVVVINHCKHT